MLKRLQVIPQLLIGLLAGAALAGTPSHPPLDLVLAGGTIIDGSGAPRRKSDIGIADGRIAVIGDLSDATAAKRIDIRGRVATPGFIDVHTHADRAFDHPVAGSIEGFLRQGVTTAVIGVDGFIGLGRLRDLADMAGRDEIGINFLSYIGHNALRREVMGMEQRAPTPEELQAMQTLVKEAMDFGTAGLSTGLMYLPGRYAATEEIIELAKVTATYGGVYDSHTRDPVNALLASHRECLDIAAAAGVDAHPGHIKAVGEKNFGRGPELVAMIEARIAGGENITVDIYPYDGAAAAPVIHLLYPGRDAQGESLMARMQAASDMETEDPSTKEQLTVDLRQYWQDVADNEEALAQAKELTEEPADSQFSWINTVGYGSLRIVVSDNPAYEDRLVSELASELGLDPFELLRRIIAAEGDSAMVTLGAIQEADVRVILKRPWTMVSSDGQELEPKHPRGRGTFPRLLGRYVREWKVLTLEDAVYKITGLPASYLKLSDRGVLRVGAIADITVFDPDTIIDRATWAEPTLFADGVDYVFIKGQAALANGVRKPQRHGRFIPFRNAANTEVTET